MLEMILAQLGLRLDSKYTAALDQQLEFVRAQTYDIKYPTLKARRFIPVDTSVDPGAESFAYYQWDEYGIAEIISNYADDLTMVGVLAEKFSALIHSLGKGYDYSLQDLRRAAMSGSRLSERKARAARRAFELAVENIAATGNAKAQIKGFLNHPNVTILTAANDGVSTVWNTGRSTPKAPESIKNDMFTAVTEIFTATKEVFQANTLLLATANYGYISQASVGTENQTTILNSFLANNPTISTLESWGKLNTADAAGTGPRMVAYAKDPEVLQLVIPQEFEQLPPQARNLAFVVPCHSRIGGVSIQYPLAIAYMDGT